MNCAFTHVCTPRDRMPLNGLLGEQQTFPPKSFLLPRTRQPYFPYPTSMHANIPLPRSTFRSSNLPTTFHALQLINPALHRSEMRATIPDVVRSRSTRTDDNATRQLRVVSRSEENGRCGINGFGNRAASFDSTIFSTRLSKQCYFSARYARPI